MVAVESPNRRTHASRRSDGRGRWAKECRHRHTRDRRSGHRLDWLWLLGITLLATALRVIWIARARTMPVPLMDSFFYDQTARRVADGLGFTSAEGIPTALFPPGYPVILAEVYRLVGADVAVAQGFNVVLSAGIILLTYAAGRLIVGRGAALVGALLWAVFPSQVLWSSLVMSELLFTLACLASLTCFLATGRTASPAGRLCFTAASGATAGAALLIRGQALGLCVVFAAWLLLRRRSRDRWLLACLFLLVTAAMVTPWTVRNTRRLDAFVPISTTVGWNAAIGHSEYATGTFWSPISVGLFGEHYLTPYPAREVAFHRAGLRVAWDWARHHPREELRLSLVKTRMLWGADDDAVAWQVLGGAGSLTAWEHAHLPEIVNHFYAVVLLLACLGLLAGLMLRRPWALLVLLLLSWTAFHILFFAANRYHYPLLPLLCLAAAVGVQVGGTMLARTVRLAAVRYDRVWRFSTSRREAVIDRGSWRSAQS